MSPILIRILGLWVVARFLGRRRCWAGGVSSDIMRLSVQDRGRLLQRLAVDSTAPAYARAIALLPSLYVLAPFDLVPDALPVVGNLDDEVVLGAALTLLGFLMPRQALERQVEALSPRPPAALVEMNP